jgi:hypothetical protein
MSVSGSGRGSIEQGGGPSVEPLWVRPKTAAMMLSVGVTKIYGLLAAGELESCLDGAARKISTASIKSFVARRLEAGRGPMVRESRAAKLPTVAKGIRRRVNKGAASEPREASVRPRPPRPPLR